MQSVKKIPLTEKQVREQCCDYLDRLKIFWFWNLQGLGSFKGTPDIIAILKNGIVLFTEFKKEKGGIQSGYQSEFQENIERNNQVYLLINNSDDLIKAVEFYLKEPGILKEPLI